MRNWPSVSVVVPTVDRPLLLAKAVDTIAAQQYPGDLEIIVVKDGAGDLPVLPDEVHGRRLRTVANTRSAGLPGARNAGLEQSAGNLLAYCDDDDMWMPSKLIKQVELLSNSVGHDVASCGVLVQFEDRVVPRLVRTDAVTHERLLRSRMSMIHSSTLLFRRESLQALGGVDETAPSGQNEDWDLLLRATKRAPVVVVDEPLVRILWGRTSFFAHQYESKIEGLAWILDRHADLRSDRPGSARVLGQMAFWQASAGQKAIARQTARKALARDPRQWRAAAALLVASGAVSGDSLLRSLHKLGRGV